MRCLKYLFGLSVHHLSLLFWNLIAYYGAIENGDLRMVRWFKKIIVHGILKFYIKQWNMIRLIYLIGLLKMDVIWTRI
jgi:hypothetical protein